MTTTPLISVVMPVYNTRQYLRAAVESILNQTFEDFEFLIYDDGSTDGSREILAEYARHDPRIELFFGEHQGLVPLLNQGMERARGTYYARMDSDDISMPERFALQVQYLKENDPCAAVSGQVVLIDSEDDPLTQLTTKFTHQEIEADLLAGRGSALVHAAVMMRTANLREVGGYRIEYQGGEDTELFLRMAETGKLANLPETIFKVRKHASSVTTFANQQEADARQDKIVLEAQRRRGLTPQTDHIKRYREPSSLDELYARWIGMSLDAGYLRTAWKYTWRLVFLKPLRMRTYWHIFVAYAYQLKQKWKKKHKGSTVPS